MYMSSLYRQPQGVMKVCVLVAFCLLTGGSYAGDSGVARTRAIYKAAVKDPGNGALVAAYIATLIETPRGSHRYVVEGDIPMSRDEIVFYLASLSSPHKSPFRRSRELIVNQYRGSDDFWRDPKDRALRYRFDERSFPDPTALAFVRLHLAAAAHDWEAACPNCGVTIRELESPQQRVAEAPRVMFTVRYVPEVNGEIALSFFPSAKPEDRVLSLYPSYLQGLKYDPTGILTHELGHILGYRHEHIVGIPGCALEHGAWRMITPYTANSVMHYFCGNAGSLDLALRPNDILGHRCLYETGAPCPPRPTDVGANGM
jgi:hypothetical protein